MGERIEFGGIVIEFLVDADDSGGSHTVFECTIAAGATVPTPHSHDGFEETIYGLDGVCTWTVDGETREIRPGEAICIRRGHVHGFDNRTDAQTKFLAIASPGVFGPAFFRDMRDVVAAAAAGPPDMAKIMAVMRLHGLTPAPAARAATQ